MKTVTTYLKENLAYRHAKNQQASKVATASNPSEDKYLQYFETINKVVYPTQQRTLLESYEDKYQQTMFDYSSKISPIDSIVASNQDIIHLGAETQQMVQTPLIPNLKQSSYDQIKLIREIFEGRSMRENLENYSNNLLVVEQYAEILMKIGRRDVVLENKLLAKSKAIIKDPTYNELQVKEIQTDDRQFESMNRQPSEKFERTKRKDLILMELLRQKKRRGVAQDYFAVMEMKLMQFLDFILEDEEEYISLQPQVKIKSVLKNLQNFQGKKVEGQSKINLLRIFFQEFTTLKHEKEEMDALKTPMKKNLSKERQGTMSTKYRETSSKATPHRKQTGTKTSKRQPPTQINWIESEKIDKKMKVSRQKREPMDQWIGSLH